MATADFNMMKTKIARTPGRKRTGIAKVPVVLFVFIFSLQSLLLKAQEEFIEPPSRFLARVPIEIYTGGVVVMKARLDPFPDTLNFIFDTGSSGISLDSITADYLKLQASTPEKMIRGIAGVRKVGFLFNQTLHLEKLKVDSLNMHVNDYRILTAVYGEQIDGIIGYSVFSRYIVKINYDSSFVDFYSKGSIRYPKGGFMLRPQITNLPFQSARAKDDKTKNARFLYDIGAGLCVLFSKDFIEDSSLLHRKRKLLPKQGEGIGGKVDMHLTVIREFKIGPYRFRKVPVYIFEDLFNVTSYPQLGGLIGNDLLRRFNCILNYDKREFYITPNTHFREPFDYSYSGIELYMINGQIVLGEVAKASPAEKAGLKEGDVVMAINNNVSQNMNQYKILLQTAKETIRIMIRRNGELMIVPVKVKSIL